METAKHAVRRQLAPNEVDKFLKKMDDDSVVFKCPHAEITVKQDYIDKGIVEIVGKNINLFGLFYLKIWEDIDVDNSKPRTLFFKFRGKINSAPSNITTGRDENGEKTVTFSYKEGDAFITNLNVASDSAVASKMLNIMTLGYLPNTLSYEEIAQYWSDVNSFNGVKLSAMSQASIEMITSEMCRDPKQLANAFRQRLAIDPNFNRFAWKIININLIPRYSSAFASLISGNPRENLISIISRQRQGVDQKDSPVEDAIL